MKELIRRVEMAEGPDRELDGAIWCEINDEMAVLTTDLPYYTSSVDAALTLVPEGWNGSVDWLNGRFGAVLNSSPFSMYAVIVDCGSLPLALTAAALRAINESK